MLGTIESVVILAQSGRALAQSAHRAGLRCLVFDAYADLDTRQCAERAVRLEWADNNGPLVDARYLLDRIDPDWTGCNVGLVYGGGLEAKPELLRSLSGVGRLCGNSTENLEWVTNPELFFKLLDGCAIPHPEIRFFPPRKQAAKWLVKQSRSCGGSHVRNWRDGAPFAHNDYFQRRLAGPVMSLLFLADGERLHVVGFNTQWSAAESFAFGGAVNRAELDSKQRSRVVRFAEHLTEVLGLRGMNSLDFIFTGQGSQVLELNPRPSASFELYDADYAGGLLHWHLQACAGKLPNRRQCRASPVRAFKVFYAGNRINLPAERRWPEWCHDIPLPGTAIDAGQPVCTLGSEGLEVDFTDREGWCIEGMPAQLYARQRQLEGNLCSMTKAA